MLRVGMLLESSAELEDRNFQQAKLLIIEKDEAGSIGLVVNKLFDRTLNELEEYSHLQPFPLYDGGPVQKDKLYFIHRLPSVVPGGTLIKEDIYFGGDFNEVIAQINSGKITAGDLKIFIGYCGWDTGQLEEEIAEGSWIISTDQADPVFSG